MATDKEKLPAYFTIGKVISYAMYIWVIFGIIVLALRVFLLAFSASAVAPFVKFIYTTSESFLNPFRGIFPVKPIGETGYLDVAALFAIIIYALIGWGFKALVDYIQAKSEQYVHRAERAQVQTPAAEPSPSFTVAATEHGETAVRTHQHTARPARYM